MTDLYSRLLAAIQAQRGLAEAASQDIFGHSTPTGEHWQWECRECDTPIPITPVTILDEFLYCPSCGEQYVRVGLRSIEGYADRMDSRPLPHLAVGTEEVQPPVAAHIAANDPASTLRACDYALGMLERHQPNPNRLSADDEPTCEWCGPFGYTETHQPWPCADIRDLAAWWLSRVQ